MNDVSHSLSEDYTRDLHLRVVASQNRLFEEGHVARPLGKANYDCGVTYSARISIFQNFVKFLFSPHVRIHRCSNRLVLYSASIVRYKSVFWSTFHKVLQIRYRTLLFNKLSECPCISHMLLTTS